MPEHAHVLIYPVAPEYRVRSILNSIKKSVANRALAFVRSQAPAFLARMTDRRPNGKVAIRFWQRGGGYDRNLWNPRYVWEMIDCIHGNPIRRGLCAGAADWPWSSAREYREPGSGPLRIDAESLPGRPGESTR
jgi:putative transposase